MNRYNIYMFLCGVYKKNITYPSLGTRALSLPLKFVYCTILLPYLFCLKYIFFSPQAASTPLNPLSFQCEFVKLRIDLLQAFSQLICTCNSLKTSPPPAIATTIAMTLGNELQRCGRISNQACVSLFSV